MYPNVVVTPDTVTGRQVKLPALKLHVEATGTLVDTNGPLGDDPKLVRRPLSTGCDSSPKTWLKLAGGGFDGLVAESDEQAPISVPAAQRRI